AHRVRCARVLGPSLRDRGDAPARWIGLGRRDRARDGGRHGELLLGSAPQPSYRERRALRPERVGRRAPELSVRHRAPGHEPGERAHRHGPGRGPGPVREGEDPRPVPSRGRGAGLHPPGSGPGPGRGPRMGHRPRRPLIRPSRLTAPARGPSLIPNPPIQTGRCRWGAPDRGRNCAMKHRLRQSIFAVLLAAVAVGGLAAPLSAQEWPRTWQEQNNFRAGPTPFEPLMEFWYELARLSPEVSIRPLTMTLLDREFTLVVVSRD